MKLDRFYDYVDSFGKNPGAFTDDEMLEICSVFKVFVAPRDKNWDDLLERLGTADSVDAWTHRVSRMFKSIPAYEKKIYNMFAQEDSNIKTPTEKDIDVRMKVLYKQQTKVRDDLNAIRRNLREEARIEELKDRIQTAARSLPTFISPVKFEASKMTSDAHEAILMLSDWHLGALVDNFYNKYNMEIAQKELMHLVQDVNDYCNKLGVYKLNVLNMGDLIHGGIHTNTRIEQEVDVITQIEFAGQLLYKVLVGLEEATPIVTYRSCSDNHSRLMPNKSEHIEKENFGRLIDWWLEAKLEQGGHTIQVIRDNLDFGLGKFELSNGKKVVFAHGHEDTLNQAYQNFTGATKEFIDYILLAHYHNPKEKTFQDCKVIVNGSLVGTEQYALSKRLFGSPTQKLLIFDEGGTLIDISLDVNTRRDKK